MKLNTLLLTSAATLMATSVAFAADLPSKKAAPSSGSVQVCKVGGMTGWTLPGSDTCVSLGGWVRANYQYDLNSTDDDGVSDWSTWAGAYRLNLDARSNTEIGVVRGYGRLENGDLKKAYIQFSGVTAGLKDSIADIFGTNSMAFGQWGQGSTGIDYKLSAGGLTFGIGAESSNDNNFAGTADRPDLVAHVSGKVSMLDFAVAAVSHEAVGGAGNVDGHALLGRVGASVSNVNVYAWGGMAENASAYTGGTAFGGSVDYDGDDLDSSVWGVGATFTQGKITVGAEFAQYHSSYALDPTLDEDTNDLAIFATYQLAKNLSITAEYNTASSDHFKWDADDEEYIAASSDVDTFYVRIQRDF